MPSTKRSTSRDKGSSKLASSMLRAYTDVTAPPEAESPKEAQRLADASRTPIKVGSTRIAERENPDDLYQKPVYRAENDFSLSDEGPEEGGASLGLEQHPTLPQRDGMPATRLSKAYEKQKRKLERESKSRKEKEELLLKQALKNKPELKLKQRAAPKLGNAPRYRSAPTPRPRGF
jgi:hypothetical protein